MDSVCRYGGEEFAVILPQTSKQDTFSLAERLREKIASHSFSHMDEMPNKKLSVSLGISSFPENGGTNSELITAADKFLYLAKSRGKNKTCC
jgi:diguanylate cyclase (GGDEF)-like protein